MTADFTREELREALRTAEAVITEESEGKGNA
jgi:hypothetical protein